MPGTGSDARNPVTTHAETSSWPPLTEATQYLHLHPDVYFRHSQEMETIHGAELELIDLTLTHAQRLGETRSDPTRTHSRSGPIANSILTRFRQQAAIAADRGGYPAGQISRIEKFGLNAFTDNSTEDEEEYHPDQVRHLRNTDRKDLIWITDGASADIKMKLAYMALASKYSGHGTPMSELKSRRQHPTLTSCNSNLANNLCDCFQKAATDMGRKYASAIRALA